MKTKLDKFAEHITALMEAIEEEAEETPLGPGQVGRVEMALALLEAAEYTLKFGKADGLAQIKDLLTQPF